MVAASYTAFCSLLSLCLASYRSPGREGESGIWLHGCARTDVMEGRVDSGPAAISASSFASHASNARLHARELWR